MMRRWKRIPHYCLFLRGIHRSPVDFRHNRSLMRNFDIVFDVNLNKLLNKQSICWRFATPWRSCDITVKCKIGRFCSCLPHHKEAEQNGCHFANNTFKCVFFNENVWITINIRSSSSQVWLSNNQAYKGSIELDPGVRFTKCARNSDSMETSPYCNSITGPQITTKFCTCHESTACRTMCKFGSDHFGKICMRVKWIFHHIWIVIEIFIVKWYPGTNTIQDMDQQLHRI